MALTSGRLALIAGVALLVAVLAGSAARWGPALARGGVPSEHVRFEAEYLGTALDQAPAPEFRLIDQHGRERALVGFRGKAVAFAFLDPRCTDACPLTALHFRQAAEQLGEGSASVAFVAVNVNKNAASVEDVAEATRKWGNAGMANWHFLTGTEAELRPIWNAFHVVAEGGAKADKPQEQRHTAGVFLLDGAGRKRWYVSVPLHGGEWTGRSLGEVLARRLQELVHEG